MLVCILSKRICQDGPKVLEDISFEVKPGERIGIGQYPIGRPSDFIHCFVQLVELEVERY